jgi:hypothetical protein
LLCILDEGLPVPVACTGTYIHLLQQKLFLAAPPNWDEHAFLLLALRQHFPSASEQQSGVCMLSHIVMNVQSNSAASNFNGSYVLFKY